MKKIVAFTFLALSAFEGMSQDSLSSAQKGSYLYYGQPSVEDNSMLIEEAFNQEAGVIQHISNFVFDDGAFVYSYTQEIPLAGDRHQLSFTIPFSRLPKPDEIITKGNDQYVRSGLGDIYVNYRPMLFDKNDWALVIPRFTLIVPTGNAQYGLGAGGFGGQFNLAVTKRLSRKFVSHWNAGYTYFSKSKYYELNEEGRPDFLYARDLNMKNVGASLIWFVRPKFNLMLEALENFEAEISNAGSIQSNRMTVINPGFRFALDIGKVQVVPGVGFPFNFANGSYTNSGTFIYLSIEPAY